MHLRLRFDGALIGTLLPEIDPLHVLGIPL